MLIPGIAGSLLLFNYNNAGGNKVINPQQLNFRRKYYHGMAVAIFLPGFLLEVKPYTSFGPLLHASLLFISKFIFFSVLFSPLQKPHFMSLSFSFAFSAMIMFEYIRFFRVWPVGNYIDAFLAPFLDSKDCGSIILAHIYLLVGCALPVWLDG